MKVLKGRNALVTGGSRGIGPHIALALAREGVNIALTARSAEKLEFVSSSVEREGVRGFWIACDINRHEDRNLLVEKTCETFGSIDILVNNAGIESEGSFLDLEPGVAEKTIRTNFLSPLELIKLILSMSDSIALYSAEKRKQRIPLLTVTHVPYFFHQVAPVIPFPLPHISLFIKV